MYICNSTYDTVRRLAFSLCSVLHSQACDPVAKYISIFHAITEKRQIDIAQLFKHGLYFDNTFSQTTDLIERAVIMQHVEAYTLLSQKDHVKRSAYNH